MHFTVVKDDGVHCSSSKKEGPHPATGLPPHTPCIHASRATCRAHPAMQATPLQDTNERQDTDQYVEPALRVNRMETRSLAAEAESAEVCPRFMGTSVPSLMPRSRKVLCGVFEVTTSPPLVRTKEPT